MTKARSIATRVYCLAMIVLLIGAIAAPLPGLFATPQVSGGEKRRLAPRPVLPVTKADWEALPDRWNAFINDHFGFRLKLIKLHSWEMLTLFNKSVSQRVIIGRAGWLFYKDDNSAELFRNEYPLTDQDVDRWVASIRRRQQWTAERGIAYLLAVAPDKHTIYPEYMPAEMGKTGPQSQLDQIVAASRATADLPLLDLRPALLAAKAQSLRPLYWRTDTHWTSYGAYVGYRAIMERLSHQVSGQPVLDLGDEAFVRRTRDTPGDLAGMLALPTPEEEVFVDEGHYRCHYQTTNDPVPSWLTAVSPLIRTRCPEAHGKLLVIRDSFSTALLPFISQSFGEVVYAWTVPYERDFARVQALVDREHPDMVIEEWVERSLQWTPDPLSPPARPSPDGLVP